MATVFRPPLITRTWRNDHTALRSQQNPNNAIGLLSLAVPIKGITDPPYRRAGRPVELLSWLGSINQNITPQANPPTGFDWPNPNRSGRPVSLLTLINSAITSNPVPLNQYDWPNPSTGARRGVDGRTLINPVITALTGDKPFLQTEWPNPKGGRRGLDALTIANPMITALTGNIPFNQTDWPVPQKYQRRVVDLLSFYNPAIAASNPFSQSNWPVAQGARRGISLLSALNSVITAQGDKPFLLSEWPVPGPYKRANQLLQLAYPVNPNTQAPSGPPIRLSDWPLPVRRPFPGHILSWVRGLYSLQLGTGVPQEGDNLDVTSRHILQDPVDCVLAGDQDRIKAMGTEYEVYPQNLRSKTTIRSSKIEWLGGGKPSFSSKTTKLIKD